MTESEEFRALIERAAAIPDQLATALAGRAEARLVTEPTDGGWSVLQIVAHLRASDDILGYRAFMLLARDEPPLPAFDERRWAEVAGYANMRLADSLAVYAGRRAELVAMLRAAPAEVWSRVGISEIHGRITLLQLLRALVEHEEEHLPQLREAVE